MEKACKYLSLISEEQFKHNIPKFPVILCHGLFGFAVVGKYFLKRFSKISFFSNTLLERHS
jgi:hypothetical protein